VNVGVELARTGRRVLLVDFDLEAPGLDTFSLLKPKNPSPGVVEYVSEFAASGVAPDVRDYFYECTGLGDKGGRLFVMPAGQGGPQYAKRLEAIDWKSLYREGEGFLMIEDLREQWRVACEPDYVLVDSRTGHTDVGGICTRQLPDALVVLFFPNEQNLAGLRPIVAAVRGEHCYRAERQIQLHFVMSNVPDLDDEDEILARLSTRFRKELGYESPRVIHRYDSLSLLEQSVFVNTHPKSRLAREYRELLGDLATENPEDREGAKRYLEGLARPLHIQRSKQEADVKRLEDIVSHHIGDPEILFLSAMGFQRRGLLDRSIALIDKAISLGFRDPGAFLERATASLQASKFAEAAEDVLQALHCEHTGLAELSRSINLLQRCCPQRLLEAVERPAVTRLEAAECGVLARQMHESTYGLQAIVKMLSHHVGDEKLTVEQPSIIRSELSLAYIGLGMFSHAVRLYGSGRPEPSRLSIQDAFNYGMAEWGLAGGPQRDMFEQVVKEMSAERAAMSANYSQCLAIAIHICGNDRDAIEYLSKAEKIMCERTPWSEFSCWRYLAVDAKGFSQDCQDMRNYILEGRGAPAMFAHKASN